MAGVFKGCQITLEFDSSLPFKKKSALKQTVIDKGGLISFIVTKKVRKMNCSFDLQLSFLHANLRR